MSNSPCTASIINQYDRITGDSILGVTEKVLRERKKLPFDEIQKVIHDFIHYQKMRPDPEKKNEMRNLNSVEKRRSQKVMNKIIGLVREHRESLQGFPYEIFIDDAITGGGRMVKKLIQLSGI